MLWIVKGFKVRGCTPKPNQPSHTNPLHTQPSVQAGRSALGCGLLEAGPCCIVCCLHVMGKAALTLHSSHQRFVCLFVCTLPARLVQRQCDFDLTSRSVGLGVYGAFLAVCPSSICRGLPSRTGGLCVLGLRGLVCIGRPFSNANRLMLLLVLADEC